LFGCKEGNFPFRYLGIAMHFRKLSNKVSSLIEEHFEKQKFGSWKSKLLSSGGRLVLINSVLSSLSMFMFFFLFLKEYLNGWITTDPHFFSNVMIIGRSIRLLSGMYFANQDVRGVWAT